MDPDDLRMFRLWRLRGAALLLLVVLAGVREAPVRLPAPAAAPPAPDRILEASNGEAANEEAKSKPKPKDCNPACKAPQVCADGTCDLPALQHSPALQRSPARLHGPHTESQVTWILDSLR